MEISIGARATVVILDVFIMVALLQEIQPTVDKAHLSKKGQELLQVINERNTVLQAILVLFKDEKKKARRIE